MKFYSALSVVSASLMLMANAQTFEGSATFYGTSLGACGITNQDSDLVVALWKPLFDSEDYCFKNIAIHYQGKSVTAMVVTDCPECNPNGLDLSPAAFSQLADLSAGRITVDWEFL